MSCPDDEPHGLTVECYRTPLGWAVHVMACPAMSPDDQLLAVTAIGDALNDTRAILIQQNAQRN